jgi:hypothetical protein
MAAHSGMATATAVDAEMPLHQHSDDCCEDRMPESCALQGVGHCAPGGTALFALTYGWPEISGVDQDVPHQEFLRVTPPPATDPPPPRI